MVMNCAKPVFSANWHRGIYKLETSIENCLSNTDRTLPLSLLRLWHRKAAWQRSRAWRARGLQSERVRERDRSGNLLWRRRAPWSLSLVALESWIKLLGEKVEGRQDASPRRKGVGRTFCLSVQIRRNYLPDRETRRAGNRSAFSSSFRLYWAFSPTWRGCEN